jgi:hypothetical protein
MKKSSSLYLGIAVIIIALLVIFVLPKKDRLITPDENTSTGTSDLPTQDGLPKAVEAKRQAIYDVAMEEDYVGLTELTDPATFKYSFGGEYEGGFTAWRQYVDDANTNDNTFTSIPELLGLPYAYLPEQDIYVWPSYFPKSVEAWTEEDVGLMKLTMTDAEIQNYRKAGGYLGYRIGIKGDGTWIYYLAGD